MRLALAAAALCAVQSVSRADSIWQAAPATPADWFTPANWNGGVPTSSIIAQINNAGTAEITAGAALASSLRLGNTSTDSGAVTMSGGTLEVTGTQHVGRFGTGTFTQSGGTVNTDSLSLALATSSTGNYYLSGGTLNVNGFNFIGEKGTANVIQTGGTFNSPSLWIGQLAGSSATYSLVDGQLNTGPIQVIGGAGIGTLNQSGGTNTNSGDPISTDIWIAASVSGVGTYNLTGGQLTSSNLFVGRLGKGTFTQSAGTATLAGVVAVGFQSSSFGEMSLSQNASFSAGSFLIGWSGGTGQVSIAGGSTTVASFVSITNPTSFLRLTGGTLNAPQIHVNSGTFSHTAGSLTTTTVNNSASLHLNTNATITTINLNGGTLSGRGTITGKVLAGSAPHTIAPSAGLSTTGTLTLGTLATKSFTTLALNLNNASSAQNDKLVVTGTNTLTLNGGILTINSPDTPESLGTYTNLQYNGAIQGTGPSSLSLPATTNNITYFLDTSNPTLIKLHKGYVGDANDDGTVNFSDFIILSQNFGQPGTWNQANFNNDSVIDFTDFVTLSQNFGNSIAAASLTITNEELAQFHTASQSFFAAQGIPEPTTLPIAAMAALALLRRRRP
jgi:uncharacterized protein (TIGR03382 family)